MNILVISPFMPCLGRHGGAAQMYNLWSAFSRIEHTEIKILTYLTEMEDGQEPTFMSSFTNSEFVKTDLPEDWRLSNYIDSEENFVQLPFYKNQFNEKLRSILNNEEYDLVVIEMQFMMHYAEFIKRISSELPLYLVVHESLEHRYADNEVMLKDFMQYKARYSKYIDVCITFSEQDKRKVEKYGCPVIVSPLCVQKRVKLNRKRKFGKLAFLGSYGHSPNVDSVDFIIEKVLPLLKSEFEFVICGSQLTETLVEKWSQSPGVEVVGFVDSADEVYSTSHVFLAPIISGTGVRTKIIEALFQGTVVVTTTLGTEGIDAEVGRDLFVFDDPLEIANFVESMLESKEIKTVDAARLVSKHNPEDVAASLYKDILELSISDV